MFGDYDPSPRAHVLGSIPSGIDGVRATLRLMVEIVRQYKTDPNLVEFSAHLLKLCGVRPKDWSGEVRCLHNWVRDNIRYVRDVRDCETLRTPPEILRIQSGDCDDKSILLATMLEAVGYKTKFAAIGVRGEFYSHVLPFVILGRSKIPLETILDADPRTGLPVEPGWFPPDATSLMWGSV